MGMVAWLTNAAAYGFATVPLLIFIVWTWKGNWYTYDLGWMIMILDLGLWMLDLPSVARHVIHINPVTDGWRIYYAIAEWMVLLAMTWRGFKLTWGLVFKRGNIHEHEQREVRSGPGFVPEGVRPERSEG